MGPLIFGNSRIVVFQCCHMGFKHSEVGTTACIDFALQFLWILLADFGRGENILPSMSQGVFSRGDAMAHR